VGPLWIGPQLGSRNLNVRYRLLGVRKLQGAYGPISVIPIAGQCGQALSTIGFAQSLFLIVFQYDGLIWNSTRAAKWYM
jgi:hypothetical protein